MAWVTIIEIKNVVYHIVQHFCDSAPFSVNIKRNKLDISDVQIPFVLCPVPVEQEVKREIYKYKYLTCPR